MCGSALILVVAGERALQTALADAIGCLGFATATFAHPEDALRSVLPDTPSCLVLDLDLPEATCLSRLKSCALAQLPPVIFVTDQRQLRLSLRSALRDSVDILAKQPAAAELASAIETALERDRRERWERAELALLQSRFDKLTPRERQVMGLIVRGSLNKQAAAELEISEVTLQIHRGRVMKKMQAESLASLVRMAVKLGL